MFFRGREKPTIVLFFQSSYIQKDINTYSLLAQFKQLKCWDSHMMPSNTILNTQQEPNYTRSKNKRKRKGSSRTSQEKTHNHHLSTVANWILVKVGKKSNNQKPESSQIRQERRRTNFSKTCFPSGFSSFQIRHCNHYHTTGHKMNKPTRNEHRKGIMVSGGEERRKATHFMKIVAKIPDGYVCLCTISEL